MIDHFNWIHRYCTGNAGDAIDSAAIIASGKGMAPYRNLVHEDLIGMRVDEKTKKASMPIPDKLEKYIRWSCLRSADPADFIEVDQYVADASKELCEMINLAWEAMLKVSKDIFASERYIDLLPARATAVPAAGEVVLTSNSQGVRSNAERVVLREM